MTEGRVAWLHVAPVKSTALQELDEAWLDIDGATGDRCFLLLDDRDHLVNGVKVGRLARVRAEWDAASALLTVRIPGRPPVRGTVELEDPRTVTIFGDGRTVRSVHGPWAEALSEWAGRPLQLVAAGSGGAGLDRARGGGVTLLGTASLTELARRLGVDRLDPRRFRMLVGVDGIPAFAEDRWVGRQVRVGDATVLVHGNVGRCAVTTQDPDTGEADLPTLRALRDFRGTLEATEPLPFGVWGEVVEPGRVALGDAITPAG